jgi:hypothetical protein
MSTPPPQVHSPILKYESEVLILNTQESAIRPLDRSCLTGTPLPKFVCLTRNQTGSHKRSACARTYSNTAHDGERPLH